MIISHKYKFIFVKTAKVAGTSLEIALRPHLGPKDISTPVAWYDEEWAKRHGIPGPQNYENFNSKYAPFHNKGIFDQHLYAYEIRGLVGDKIWEEYFTFTIEREPHEKTVSNYYHYRSKLNKINSKIALYYTFKYFLNKIKGSYKNCDPSIAQFLTFNQWVEADILYSFSQNYLRYTINDQIIVKKVYPYKYINLLIEDLQQIIGKKIELPKLKSGFTPKKRKTLGSEEIIKLSNRLKKNVIFKKEYGLLEKLYNEYKTER